MDNSILSETEILQELAHRHDDILARLDELDTNICSVINEFLGKSGSTPDILPRSPSESAS